MAVHAPSSLTRPGLWRTLLTDVRLALRLLREPAVPIYLKSLPFVAVLYVLSPLDFLPDMIPVIGQLDDIGVVIIGIKAFLMMCPAGPAAFHREALAMGKPFAPMAPSDNVINADFRRQ